MRFRHRLDAAHADIVAGLVTDGYSVQSLAGVGDGFFDLIVGWPGGNILLEVKSPKAWRPVSTVAEARELTQRRRQAAWKGPKATVRSLHEARTAIALWKVQT